MEIGYSQILDFIQRIPTAGKTLMIFYIIIVVLYLVFIISQLISILKCKDLHKYLKGIWILAWIVSAGLTSVVWIFIKGLKEEN